MTGRRLSICFFAATYLDGDPRVLKEAASAAREGHRVTVVCRSYEGPPLPYEVVATAIGRGETRLAKYAERGRMAGEFLRTALRVRPDVIHAVNLDSLAPAWLASRLTGARLLYDAFEFWAGASIDVGERMRRAALAVERLVARRADAVVTVSQPIAERLAETLSIRTPTVVMNTPPYVDAARLEAQKWARGFAPRRVVLHQGKYLDGRGILEAILAWKHLDDDVVLAFRGFGPLEVEMRALVARERLQDKVFFLPAVGPAEVVPAAIGADLGLVLYVPLNVNNTFAAPNKLFEYVMAGVPPVVSDMPFLARTVRERRIGGVFRAGDPEDLARVVRALLSRPDELVAMRQRCLAAARELSWEADEARLLDVYRRLGDLGRRASLG